MSSVYVVHDTAGVEIIDAVKIQNIFLLVIVVIILKSFPFVLLRRFCVSSAEIRENFWNSLTTSKVAYFKRKYAEEEDLHKVYNGYFPKVRAILWIGNAF